MNPSPFHIGVSGHQNLGDAATWQFVAQQFRELLTLYQQKTNSLVLYSSLAVGADQLFVQTALEFSIPVEAVIPCSGCQRPHAFTRGLVLRVDVVFVVQPWFLTAEAAD
jgi:hypothetical protein